MKIEEQVLTIEQMQHLKELGVEVKDTAIVLDTWGDPYPTNTYFEEDLKECTPTLTLQEILEMLPRTIECEGQRRRLFLADSITNGQILYEDIFGNPIFESEGETFLESAYMALCWVAENGYLNKE